jgi:hypothetical protein
MLSTPSEAHDSAFFDILSGALISMLHFHGIDRLKPLTLYGVDSNDSLSFTF